MKTLEAKELFLTNRKAKGCTQKSRDWYEKKIDRFAASYPELPTEPEPIEDFLASFPDEQDEYRHGHYRALLALYRFLHRRHRLESPMQYVDPPKRRKKVQPTLEPAELLLVSLQAKTLRDRTILEFIIDTGVRADELVTLTKQNVYQELVIVTGKEGTRFVPISDDTRRNLMNLMIPESDLIFRGQRGPLTTSGLYQIIRDFLIKAGINRPKVGPHRLRHAFGKNFIENGGDVRTLQRILGHVDIKTTQIYLNLANKSIIEKHHQFTPLRSINAATQGNMFEPNKALQEAEDILNKKGRE